MSEYWCRGRVSAIEVDDRNKCITICIKSNVRWDPDRKELNSCANASLQNVFWQDSPKTFESHEKEQIQAALEVWILDLLRLAREEDALFKVEELSTSTAKEGRYRLLSVTVGQQ
ncbi:MAG: hypothetical protein AB9866_27430 [Syntrophobacteraceae bacterium]